jgi:hypothetical protein
MNETYLTMEKKEKLAEAIEKAVKNGWLKDPNRTVESVDVTFDEVIAIDIVYSDFHEDVYNKVVEFERLDEIMKHIEQFLEEK